MNEDACCHLSLCLQLFLFYWIVISVIVLSVLPGVKSQLVNFRSGSDSGPPCHPVNPVTVVHPDFVELPTQPSVVITPVSSIEKLNAEKLYKN